MKVLLLLCALSFVFTSWCFFTCSSKGKKFKVGDKAPSFTLFDDAGSQRSLAEFLGKKIVLYFYPKDNTPGCTKEACSFRDSFDAFKKNDIVVLGISYDSVASHKKFKEKQRLPFILLSDKSRKVSHMYGTSEHILGYFYPLRKTFLIDKDGIIKNIIDDVTPATHAEDILRLFSV